MIGKGGIKSGEVVAFLGKNISFEGKMGFDGMATLDGKFDGEIFCEHMLIIGETGNVNAQITVSTLVIEGKVSGNVSATDRIEIHATGQLYGNITTPILVIEEGGVFDGTCKMEKGVEAKKKVTPVKEKETEWIQRPIASKKNEMTSKIALSWKRFVKGLFSHSDYNFLFIL